MTYRYRNLSPFRLLVMVLAIISLACLTMEDHPLRVASLNASWEELQEALTTSVQLEEDQEALAEHQQDFDEASRLLKEYLLDKYHT